MSVLIPKKVGNVKISSLSDSYNEKYSDHEVEDDLLELFKGNDIETKRKAILKNSPSWPMFYHLSPKRGNLINWYNFKKDSSVLEVGAGCGGITEALVEKDVHVSALELTPKRALINAHRNKHTKNLSIIIGNLDEYTSKEKFDYVVCIGVLEYAGTFYESSTPYNDFLRSIQKSLKPGGKLLLAIENRLGLKYWAGSREDHAHTFFEGLNGYPGIKKVQTFGKKELTDLLLSTGYSATSFYYPYPDYKYPSFIYSDNYHPGHNTSFPLGALPASTPNWPREHLFSEQMAMIYLEKNGLFPEFSNSFMVEATV